MSYQREVWSRAVASALEGHAVAVEQMAPGHWTFAPRAGSPLRVSARVQAEWLLCEASVPADALSEWDLLVANGLFAGGVKFCLADRASSLRVGAELPLLDDVDVAPRIQLICAGWAAAAAWLRERRSGVTGSASWVDTRVADDFADADVEQLCRDSRWPFTPRDSSTFMVELDVPGTFQQAAVTADPQRGVVTSVPILDCAPSSHGCAAAVARLLLSTAGAVRMVRAAAGVSGDHVCFEVVFTHSPAAEELAHAFAALSLAWRCAGREAEVLARDEHIAALYTDNVSQQGSDSSTSRLTA